MGNVVIQPCTSGEQSANDYSFCLSTDGEDDSQDRTNSFDEGKVVIRPIAFKPVTSPVGQGISLGGETKESPQDRSGSVTSANGEVRAYPAIPARPDPRYTSTPTLSRGPIQHYGSMGDLKTLSHSSSYSLDRRNAPIPINTRGYHDPYLDAANMNNVNNKFSSLTKFNNNRNVNLNNKNSHLISNPISSSNNSNLTSPISSKGSPNNNSYNNIGNSPPSYPPPPPRPPSHQSTCSNIEDGPTPHQRFPYDNRLSSTYDPMPAYDPLQVPPNYTSRCTSGYDSSHLNYHNAPAADIPRFESMRNLSSDPHNYSSPGHHAHLHHPINSGSGLLRMGGSFSNLARLGHHGGSVQGLDRSISVTGSNLGLDRSVSGSNLGITRGPCPSSVSGSMSELRINDHHQTPSPSDSGVAELEAMLKEKDTEISSLKETMEQNEQVIFKVYEQKEKAWERELKKIRDMYDSRLKSAQQKALKVEQTLSTSTYQLQQERRKILAELEEAKREKDSGLKQVDQLKKEVSSLRSQLEETEWGLCQKSGEISLLKTQLKDSQGDQTTRGHELLHLRAQVRQYQQEVERRRAEIASLHDLTAQLRRDSAELRSQLDRSQHNQTQDHEFNQQKEKSRIETESHRREIEMRKCQFEDERKRWHEEKERVIRYQKQLHHNYVSILNRNRQLEEEVARLTGVPLPPSPKHGPAPPMIPPQYAELREGSVLKNSESRC